MYQSHEAAITYQHLWAVIPGGADKMDNPTCHIDISSKIKSPKQSSWVFIELILLQYMQLWWNVGHFRSHDKSIVRSVWTREMRKKIWAWTALNALKLMFSSGLSIDIVPSVRCTKTIPMTTDNMPWHSHSNSMGSCKKDVTPVNIAFTTSYYIVSKIVTCVFSTSIEYWTNTIKVVLA